MPKHNDEFVALPKTVDLQQLRRICGHTRRKIRAKCEIAEVIGEGFRIEERTLERALAAGDVGAEVNEISVAMFSRRRDDLAVVITWRPGCDSYLEVRGTDETQVLGVASALRRYVDRGRFTFEPSRRRGAWHRMTEWLRDLSVQVVGAVLGAGILALVGLVWALLR